MRSVAAPPPSSPTRKATPPQFGASLPGFFHGLASSNAGRVGMLATAGMAAQKALNFLESDQIFGLFLTDNVGMVGPRTIVEANQRGPVAAAETFRREFSCCITMLYVAGTVNRMVTAMMSRGVFNPQAVNFNAFVDTHNLEGFSHIVRDIAKDADELVKASKTPMTGKEFQEHFISRALKGLESTDPAAKFTNQDLKKMGLLKDGTLDFSHEFNGGRLKPGQIDALRDLYLDKDGIRNVEKEVVDRMATAPHKEEVDRIVARAEGKILRGRQKDNLVAVERAHLELVSRETKAAAEAAQRKSLRLLVTGEIRKQEKPFIDKVLAFATGEGNLSETLHFRYGGKHVSTRSARDYASQIKYFVEEYLNRGLAHETTGKIAEHTVDTKALVSRLFAKEETTWLRRLMHNVVPRLPKATDALLPYVWKSKWLISLAPIVMTAILGMSLVYINNYLTRLRTGSNYFPGERALIEQEHMRRREGRRI